MTLNPKALLISLVSFCVFSTTGCFHEREMLVFDDEHFELVPRTTHDAFSKPKDSDDFINNWVYDFWERPKRLYKDVDGRFWMIHGGVFQRQQFVAYLLGGLYELALSPKVAPQYLLLEDTEGRLLLGSPFIRNFQTFATLFREDKGDRARLEEKITAFLELHPEAKLEDWVALEIWTGESDMHPYNLGVVEIYPGQFQVTRVGNQHALAGLNEASARTNNCNLKVLLDYPLDNPEASYLRAVETARGWELLAQSFEKYAQISDSDLRDTLNKKLEPLRKRGIVVPAASGLPVSPLIDNFDHKLAAEVDNAYRVKQLSKNYYPDANASTEIFEASWQEGSFWRVAEEEVQAVIDELIARKALFLEIASGLRDGSLN